MRNDGGVEIACPQPDRTPNQPIPYGDPVEVLKRMYHKRIEGKEQRRGEQARGEKRLSMSDLDRRDSSAASLPKMKPRKLSSTKIAILPIIQGIMTNRGSRPCGVCRKKVMS